MTVLSRWNRYKKKDSFLAFFFQSCIRSLTIQNPVHCCCSATFLPVCKTSQKTVAHPGGRDQQVAAALLQKCDTHGWKGWSLPPSIASTRRSRLWEPWSTQTCQHCVGSRAPLCWHVSWSRVCVSAVCFKPEFLIIAAAQTLLESWYVLSFRHFFQQWVPLSNYIFCKKRLIFWVWICHLLLSLHVLFFLFWEPRRVDLLCFYHSLFQTIILCSVLIIFFLKFKKIPFFFTFPRDFPWSIFIALLWPTSALRSRHTVYSVQRQAGRRI